MLMMYGVYCIALKFNTQLEQWAQTLPIPCKSEIAHQGPPKVASEGSGLADGQRPNSYTEEKPQIMETNLGEAEEGQIQEADHQDYYHKVIFYIQNSNSKNALSDYCYLLCFA